MTFLSVRFIAVFISVLLYFGGCSSKGKSNSADSTSVDTTPAHACDEASVEQIYFQRSCNMDVCGYVHTLMLKRYTDPCFNDHNFVGIADKYLDSVQTSLPVSGVVFVKPFGFVPTYDSGDNELLMANSVVEIYYSQATMHEKVPDIDMISIWVNGERKNVANMATPHRSRMMARSKDRSTTQNDK